MGNHHDAVSGSDSGHRDKSDQGSDADVVQGQAGQDDPTDQRERDVEDDLEGKDRRPEEAVEEEGDDEQHDHRHEGDALRGLLLRLVFTFVADEVALRECHFLGDLFLQPLDTADQILGGGLDADNEAALRILPQNVVRPGRVAQIGHEL